jgi:serine/threonine-protein kinase
MKAHAPKQTVVYTAGYAAPEQMVGRAEPRSDLFSLAATLYHLATGKEPDGWETGAELEAALNDPHSSLPKEYRWFFELLKINLAQNANDRYFSAADFKADLERRRVTKETRCPRCQATTPARRPYCVRCATPLTTAAGTCGECGRKVVMGCRFCIHCGNRL